MSKTYYYTLLRGMFLAQGRSGNGSGQIHTSAAHHQEANHYAALGISKNSTQGDIKSAYYKLSMIYHPDKNQGCEASAKKFREITQAYEVLSNYRLRRLYDKGIIHTAGPDFSANVHDVADEVEDDPETKFYKSRFHKSNVRDATGRKPIYNFDEWSQAHYGSSFQRRKAAKEKFDRTEARKHDLKMASQNEYLMFGAILAAFGIYGIFYAESSYDTPKQSTRNEYADSEGKN